MEHMPWPGEWRLPGGRQREEDATPLETAARHLRQLLPGVTLAPHQLKATLQRKTASRNENFLFHVRRVEAGRGGHGARLPVRTRESMRS